MVDSLGITFSLYPCLLKAIERKQLGHEAMKLSDVQFVCRLPQVMALITYLACWI